jgi:glycosyltransferase involved in cell wall biosynthesis
MIKVLVDLYKVKNIYSGLGQFSLNFANELVNQSSEEFNFIFLTPNNFEFEDDNRYKSVKVNLQKRYLPHFTKSYEIWHGLQQFPSHFPNRKSKFILTVHDLNFLFEKSGLKKLRYLKRLQNNVDKADYITTISEFTRKSIEEHINLRGKKIITIYNGIEIKSNGTCVRPKFVNDRKFFFSIGIFKEKKNFHVLVSAMKYFKDYQLIIAGNKDTVYGRYIQQQIGNIGMSDRIILPGNISTDERYWLYRNCEAFLFPSLAEGFGMPVIEAMKFGKPVFLSKLTSLPEIGGDHAFYFDNFDEKYMSSCIESGLSYYNENQAFLSEILRQRADSFSWQKCIAEYLKLYREISNEINGTE